MKKTSRQYTIRNVPTNVDKILRQRAKESKKSFNQVVLEALIEGAGEKKRYRDLSDLAGSLSEEEASLIDEAIQWSHRVFEEDWNLDKHP